MKNIIISLLLVLTLTFPYLQVNASLNLPNLKEGDQWTYEVISHISNHTALLKIEVLGKEHIIVGGVPYDVWNTSWSFYSNLSIGSKAAMVKFVHQRISDLAIVEEVYSRPSPIAKSIYDPPVAIIKYPVDEGDMWSCSYVITVTYTSPSQNQSSYSINEQLLCTGEKNVKTKAGVFLCYKIEEKKKTAFGENQQVNQTYFYYYSSDAKNWVKMEEYNGKKLLTEITLLSYTFGGENGTSIQNKTHKTPGFGFLFVIASLGTIYFVRRLYITVIRSDK